MRWDLIEKFDAIRRGRNAQARKFFSGQEDFFKDNFPGKPLVPEPLFIEMIAQAGGVAYGLGLDFQKEVILAKIMRAAFAREVAPPCDLRVEARIEDASEDAGFIRGTVTLDGEVVAEAEIMLVAMAQLDGGQKGKSIVFNDQFMTHYDVLNIARAGETQP